VTDLPIRIILSVNKIIKINYQEGAIMKVKDLVFFIVFWH